MAEAEATAKGSYQHDISIQIQLHRIYNLNFNELPPNFHLPIYCYVRQCELPFYIVLYFFKCLGFNMHIIFLYGALSLHNCASSGFLVFAHLGRINKNVH